MLANYSWSILSKAAALNVLETFYLWKSQNLRVNLPASHAWLFFSMLSQVLDLLLTPLGSCVWADRHSHQWTFASPRYFLYSHFYKYVLLESSDTSISETRSEAYFVKHWNPTLKFLRKAKYLPLPLSPLNPVQWVKIKYIHFLRIERTTKYNSF